MDFVILHSIGVIRPAQLRPFRWTTFTWFFSGLTPSWISFSTTVLSTSEIPMILTGNRKLWNCSEHTFYDVQFNSWPIIEFNASIRLTDDTRTLGLVVCRYLNPRVHIDVIKVINHVIALGSLRFMSGFNGAFPLGKFWSLVWSQVFNAFLAGEQLWCWSALWMAWRLLPIHLWLRSRLVLQRSSADRPSCHTLANQISQKPVS